jgi:hypothetical protein
VDKRCGWRGARQAACQTDQIQIPCICETVVNVTTSPAGSDDACLAQSHQVLRDVCLALPESGLQVANTGFTAANDLQDLQAGGLVDRLQYSSYFLT